MDRRVRTGASIACLALALTATAAPAQAAPAARWKVAGAFLGNGVTKSYTSTLAGTATLEVPGLLTLESSSCSASGKIVGSGTESPGATKESVLSCGSIKVKGAPSCEVSPITTVKMKGTLGWMEETGEADILTFEPESGTEFTTVFIEECALAGEYPVTGATLGTFTPAATEVTEGTLTFGGTDTTTTEHWFKIEGTACVRTTSSSPHLQLGGRAATFSGAFDAGLSPTENFGIFAG